MLQSAALCESVLQCAVLRLKEMMKLQCVACSVLQSVAACCSKLQYVAASCSVLQRVAACCSVLQCVVVCCGVCASWGAELFRVSERS